MKIKNKKTSQIYEVMGLVGGTGSFQISNPYCIIANVKSKELEMIEVRRLVKDFEYI